MPQNTETKLAQLEKEIQTLKNPSGASSGIDRKLSAIDKKLIEEVVKETILDTVWDKYFYYHTYPESLDGWALTEAPAGSSSMTSAGVSLLTAASSGAVAYIVKNPSYQTVLSFDLESRYRTGFVVDVNAGNFSTGIGDPSGPGSYPYYGFRVENDSLYAVTSNGSDTETKVLAKTLENRGASYVYQLECRLYPGSKAVFYASDANESVLKERCTIVTNLPAGDITLNSAWITFVVVSGETAAKQALFTFAEYIQLRDPQSR